MLLVTRQQKMSFRPQRSGEPESRKPKKYWFPAFAGMTIRVLHLLTQRRRRCHKESGFTLVEIIASLLLIGFLTVFAGTGIVTFSKGYLFAKQNAHMAQKANLAMTRITRELRELTDVTGASNTAVTIETTSGEMTIGLDGTNIKIAGPGIDLTEGDILVDDVAAFALSYWKGTSSWLADDDIQYLSAIDVTLSLNRTDTESGAVDFVTTVHMRNNNNYGGAPPTSEPPSMAGYCFIQTAAAAEPAHPSFVSGRFLLFLFSILFLDALIMRHRKQLSFLCRRCFQTKGSILVGLVVTMLIISALGAAMLPLTATSTFTQLGTSNTEKAYLLAESGLRYAASEYLEAGSDRDKNDVLEDIHNHCAEDQDNKDYTLSDNAGSFKVEIYPYYFVVTSNPSGSTTLNTKVPGGYPDLDLSSAGRLKIGSNFYQYDNGSRDGQDVTFTMQDTMESIPENSEVYLVAISSSTSQEVGNGGDLVVQSGSADVFPARNGTFKVDEHLYSYKENDTVSSKLIGVEDPNDPDMTSFTVDANSEIVLQKFVKVRSTGRYGTGETAASRQLVYYVPLQTADEEKVAYTDLEEDSTTSSVGTQTVDDQAIEGRTVLKVTSTEDIGAGNVASVAALDTSTAEVDLEKVYQLSDNLLSYDTQAKIGFVTSASTYMNGISFRLDALGSNANSYGVSFVLGGASDGIPDDFIRYEDYPMIVLWQQTSSGTAKKWIAYEHLTGPVFFYDDIEGGAGGWTTNYCTGSATTPLWHRSLRKPKGYSYSWYYGRELTGTYNNNARNCGTLTSEDISISSSATNATLGFWSWYETENISPFDPNDYDQKFYEVSSDNGATWETHQLTYPDHPMKTWEYFTLPLPDYIGKTVKIRFRFDTIDGSYNNQEGWYIDDIKIYQTFSIQDATILARIQEAPSIAFTSGGAVINEGTIYEEIISIQDGDTITGADSEASATVDGKPIISSGSWETRDATGIILLKDVDGTFGASETLLLGLQDIATVNGGVSDQDNFIRVYFSDTSGYGTANSDAFDSERLANPVGTENWPPDETSEWSAATDHFTLVQWDAINDTVTTAEIVDSIDEPNAVIKSSEPELLSPTSGTFSKPELGLHAYGNSSDQVYFDDFAIQIEETVLYKVAPVQE